MAFQFDGSFKGYAVNLCMRSHWRVARIMEVDDLVQEAYLVFHKCSVKYSHVTDAPQFMALYKRALANRITDLSLKNSQLHTERSSSHDGRRDTAPVEAIGELDNDGFLKIMMKQAPAEVKLVLTMILNAPAEITEALLSSWSNAEHKKRANSSERINRALGLPPELDTMGMVQDYFRK
jgi:hypothetical protein